MSTHCLSAVELAVDIEVVFSFTREHQRAFLNLRERALRCGRPTPSVDGAGNAAVSGGHHAGWLPHDMISNAWEFVIFLFTAWLKNEFGAISTLRAHWPADLLAVA